LYLFTFRCETEYLEFRDGASRFSPLLHHVCQYQYTMDIETSDKFLYIKFFTDLNVPSNGFKLNVSIGIDIYFICIENIIIYFLLICWCLEYSS